MNEQLLQYLWNFKIFTGFDFKDTDGNAIDVLDFGQWNKNSGPDFINAKIKTKNLVLAGNIELHLRSSDWVFHNHSADRNYNNVILHAVYNHDMEIEDIINRNIPTLELRPYISDEILRKHRLLLEEKSGIPCEKIFDSEKIPLDFYEQTLLKKLDEKSTKIETDLKHFNNDFEAVLFHQMAYAFGLKINAQIFKELAESVDFNVIRKIGRNQNQLEALFFGKCGWLKDAKDEQMQLWKREYNFLKAKFQFSEMEFSPKFLRLRPANFPTIRLSQLADLYHREQNLFSKIIEAEKLSSLENILRSVSASEYWDSHYTFGKPTSTIHRKALTKPFIDLILINAVLPVKYAYHRNNKENTADEILNFYGNLPAESNSVTELWADLGLKIKSAIESQALIYHYKNFCQTKNCLNCSIGFQLLKQK